VIPEALGISVEGPFDIPSTSQRLIVDKQTAESTLQGANVYAPGIIGCGSIHPGDEVTIVSELGEIIATGTALMGANDVLTFRKGLAVRVDHRRFIGPRIRELPEFAQGLLYPQSLAAMVTGRVLNPKPGETVVDMNCAPGGKLSHLSQLMQNSGKIFGFDRNSQKIKEARQNVRNLGSTNVVLSIHDSRYLHEDFPSLKADRVLIDPPCSALGLRPKVYDFTSQKRVQDLADYQKQFIKAASKIAKRSGVIVYSVCTFTSQECEQVVDFAERECKLRVLEQKPFVGSRGLSTFGVSGVVCQRFHPYVDQIGYFIAKFEG
jgi:16S rRNA (cytosine967-C5)-methyltransferase